MKTEETSVKQDTLHLLRLSGIEMIQLKLHITPHQEETIKKAIAGIRNNNIRLVCDTSFDCNNLSND